MFKQREGVVRCVFGKRTQGQMEAGWERREAEIRRTSTKFMAEGTKGREWILVMFTK